MKVIRNARNLRDNHRFHGVFVNPDLTFAERHERKRLRDKANELKSENPDDVVLLRRGNLLVTCNSISVDCAAPHHHLFRQ